MDQRTLLTPYIIGREFQRALAASGLIEMGGRERENPECQMMTDCLDPHWLRVVVKANGYEARFHVSYAGLTMSLDDFHDRYIAPLVAFIETQGIKSVVSDSSGLSSF